MNIVGTKKKKKREREREKDIFPSDFLVLFKPFSLLL